MGEGIRRLVLEYWWYGNNLFILDHSMLNPETWHYSQQKQYYKFVAQWGVAYVKCDGSREQAEAFLLCYIKARNHGLLSRCDISS